MGEKCCPFISTSGPKACMADICMMFDEEEKACVVRKKPVAISRKMDTLIAQIQEMQVALLEIANRKS